MGRARLIVGFLMTSSFACASGSRPHKLETSPVFDELRALYPDQTSATLQARVHALGTPLDFYRAFIPFFYQRLVRPGSPTDAPGRLGDLAQADGWCIGDAHPENFGAIFPESGDPIFTVNDVDDAGPCPVVLDPLRFLGALEIAGVRADRTALLRAYRRGLDGSSALWGRKTQDLLDKARGKGRTLKKSVLDASEVRFKRQSGQSEVSAAVRARLLSALQNAYGNGASIVDALRIRRIDGGSGGLTRFWVLFREHASADLAYAEFKQISRPGIFPWAMGTIPDATSRYARTLAWEHDGRPAHDYRVLTIAGEGEFLLRPRWAGQIGADIDDGQSLYEDEMFVIGRLHRSSVRDLPSYISLFDALNGSDWDALVSSITQELKDAYSGL